MPKRYSTKYLISILQRYQGMKNKKRLRSCHKTGKDQRDKTTNCYVRSWTECWNRKRILV